MPSVTIRDVAREAEVSITTVSQILRENDRYQFHPDTILRVRAAAERLGYQAHAAARMLRQQETRMLGVAMRLTVHPHLNRLLVAVHGEIRSRGYDAVLCEPSQLMPSHSHAPFPSPEMLAGMFSLDLTMEESVPTFYESLQLKLPVIALYPVASPSVQTVSTDTIRAFDLIVRHLVELGHRRLAFTEFTGSNHPSDTLKARGFRIALRNCGIDEAAVSFVNVSHAPTIAETGLLAAERITALQPRPTAVVCPSDEVALSIAGRLGTLGWKLPEDLSLTGYDGIDFAAYNYPSLTTIRQSVEEMARVAVDCMLHRIKHPDLPGELPMQRLIEPSLLIGESTVAPK